MKLADFIKHSPALYASGKSYYLKSAPGRGKTTAIVDSVPVIANALGKNIGLSIVSGPNLTPGDTVGFGIPKHSEHNGKPVSEMVFTLPFFFRTTEGKMLEDYDGGIIFIDEADKMDVDIKKVVGEMALSGRCGPHTLPPGWVVWMAGNRAGDRSGSTKELDHLINRRIEIDIEDDVVGWEAWALKNNVPPAVVAFGVSNPQIVFNPQLPDKQGPFCTPRSTVAAGQLLVTLAGNSGEIPTDDFAVELVAGAIGQAAAAQLFTTLRLETELPKIETILSAPDQAKLPSQPDAQMLVAYKLASISEADNIAPIAKYISRLPQDFAITYVKATLLRKPMLATTPTIMQWCKTNSALVALIATLK